MLLSENLVSVNGLAPALRRCTLLGWCAPLSWVVWIMNYTNIRSNGPENEWLLVWRDAHDVIIPPNHFIHVCELRWKRCDCDVMLCVICPLSASTGRAHARWRHINWPPPPQLLPVNVHVRSYNAATCSVTTTTTADDVTSHDVPALISPWNRSNGCTTWRLSVDLARSPSSSLTVVNGRGCRRSTISSWNMLPHIFTTSLSRFCATQTLVDGKRYW